jgi:hypothetical protein
MHASTPTHNPPHTIQVHTHNHTHTHTHTHQPCSPGSYKTLNGTGVCLPCPAGKTTSPAATELCQCECALGYFATETGATCTTTCAPCAVGYYKDTLGYLDSCIKCPSQEQTTKHPNSTSLTDCGCFPGTYGPRGSGPCQPCPQGTYEDDVGATACKDCPTGSLSSDSGSTRDGQCTCTEGYTGPGGFLCAACEAGKYKNVTGAYVMGVCMAGWLVGWVCL